MKRTAIAFDSGPKNYRAATVIHGSTLDYAQIQLIEL